MAKVDLSKTREVISFRCSEDDKKTLRKLVKQRSRTDPEINESDIARAAVRIGLAELVKKAK